MPIRRHKLESVFRDLLGEDTRLRKAAASDLKFATNGRWLIEGVDDLDSFADVLIALLTDSDADRRTLAATAIASAAAHGLDVTSLRPALERATADRTKAVRAAALRALTANDLAKDAFDNVLERYDRATSEAARASILASIGDLASRGVDLSGVLGLVMKSVGTGQHEPAKRAECALSSWLESDAVDAAERRRRAERALALVPTADLERNARWQTLATRARAQIEELDPARVEATARRLVHHDPSARAEAARELARTMVRGLDVEPAVSSLETAMGDADLDVRVAASGALFEHHLAKPDFAAMARLLDHPEAAVRAEVLRRVWLTLAQRVDLRPLMARVQLMVADPSPAVREIAARAVLGGSLTGQITAADAAGTAALAERVGGTDPELLEDVEKVALLMEPAYDARASASSAPMARIYGICDTLNRWAGKLTGMDFADERGWLSPQEQDEKARMDREFKPLEQEAEQLWRELPTTDPRAVERYDARARLAVDLLTKAGGKIDGFSREDLERRGLPTASPERKFHFWAVWAVHQLTPPRRRA